MSSSAITLTAISAGASAWISSNMPVTCNAPGSKLYASSTRRISGRRPAYAGKSTRVVGKSSSRPSA